MTRQVSLVEDTRDLSFRERGMIMKLLEHSREKLTTFEPDWLSNFLPSHSPRFQHILGVVRCMKLLLPRLDIPNPWKPALLSACYLHDIGYSPNLRQFQFHPLDGAIFAHEHGFSKPVVAAILFHSCAFEQVQQTRPDLIEVYKINEPLLDKQDLYFIDLVTYCDLHTSSTGQLITFPERVKEVVERYGEDHEVSKLMVENRPYYEKIIARVNNLLKR
jgi:hypothetical protein